MHIYDLRSIFGAYVRLFKECGIRSVLGGHCNPIVDWKDIAKIETLRGALQK
jgi:hypothetical protein